MKRLVYFMVALAMTAVTLTSCSDVDGPFLTPINPNDGEQIDDTGAGGEELPEGTAVDIDFKSTQGNWKAQNVELGDGLSYVWQQTSNYGMKASAYANSTNYKSESWFVSPNIDMSKLTAATLTISHAANYFAKSAADECSVLISTDYAGDVKTATWETLTISAWPTSWDFVDGTADVSKYAGQSKVYVAFKYTSTAAKAGTWEIASCSIKQGGGDDTPSTGGELGTAENPITVSKALEAINALNDKGESTENAYVKGVVVKVTTSAENFASYGNINYYISDDGKDANTIQVYAGDGLNGNKFSAVTDIAAGDEVVVCGKLYKYVKSDGTVVPEINKGNYLVSLTKGNGGNTGGETTVGDGSESKPYSVTEAIAKATQDNVYVKAYIVGWVDGQVYASGANFNANSTIETNILIAATADETDPAKCMPVQLPSGAVRSGVNLKANAGNYKKEVLLYGNITKYFGVPGLKNTSYAVIGGTEIGTKPGGGNDNTGGGNTGGATSLDVDFKANGQGDWNIIDAVSLTEGISYVWNYDSKYGMKASAYVSGTRYVTDSWLISPALNLTNGGTLTFSQAQRYAASGCSDLHVMASTTYTGGNIDASQWTEVNIDQWPTGSDWNFITSTGTLPKGTIRIAFRYTSTTSTAATWEIQSANIK